jgi:hypothetical protein
MLAILIALGALFGAIAAAPHSARADDLTVPTGPNGMPLKAYFPETGHNLSGELLTAFNTNGLMIIGYPISEPVQEGGRTVQYFERARLEYWPEHAGTQWVVQGTLLGRLATKGREKEAPFKPLPAGTPSDTPDRVIFSETGHSLAYGFKKYWDAHGGLWQFGFPISEEFQENGLTVQYFERARFEYHPEYAGTNYEVLLGRLGADLATTNHIKQTPAPEASDAVGWEAGLFDPNLNNALQDINGGWTGFVSTDAVSVRSAPDPSAAANDVYYHLRPVVVTGLVRGQPQDGVDAWYVVGPGAYINAQFVDPLVLDAPDLTFDGHWIDINLSQFWATAYDGATPLHSVIFVAGRGDSTPRGVFNVQYRVLNETMDSPPGDPDFYHVENVAFTQYFLEGGFAVHGNYWTPEDEFGGYTSHGCVGLFNSDAEFFWNWLDVGSPVYIHF